VGLECFKGALSIGAAALIFMPFVDKVNRRGMLAISIIGQAVAIGLFVVFKVSYPVAISYVLLGGYAAAGLIGVVFAPRNTQGRTLEEIQGSDTSRPAAARV
jgi:peptidoglycan/LPS O-acetylase OafA/YrhL